MKNILRGVLGIFCFTIFFTLFFGAAYFLTTFVYQWVGTPPPLISQVVTSLVGLLLIGILGFIVSRIFKPDRNAFGPIIDAMQTIARGNFNVRVETPHRDNLVIRQLTDSVNHMAVELNQIETMRQEFISNVSHELQSPLTSIRGFARALQNDTLSTTDRHHYLDIIEIESTRLSKLTDNLLRLSCLQAERVMTNPYPYRLDRQLRELVLACEPQWMAKAIEMEVELAEVQITADPEMLSQVWSNLLQNGVKFTPHGGTIRVRLVQVGNQCRVTIQDTGIGIDEADQPHIFERFYKADKARERSAEGSGLGLSIAQQIIALHHGTIEVSSQPGAGTVFTVCLPLSPSPIA